MVKAELSAVSGETAVSVSIWEAGQSGAVPHQVSVRQQRPSVSSRQLAETLNLSAVELAQHWLRQTYPHTLCRVEERRESAYKRVRVCTVQYVNGWLKAVRKQCIQKLKH